MRPDPRIGLPNLTAPFLQRKGRIGDDAIEGSQAAGTGIREGRVPQRVLAHDLVILDAVQHEIHPRDARGGQILFLAVDLAEKSARIAPSLPDMRNRAQQHPARAAGGVVDALAFLGIENLDHHPHHAARRVEFPGLLALGDVGEFPDQVFVGIAENIGAHRLVAQRHPRKPLDEVLEDLVGQHFAVAPVCRAKHAVERLGVGPLWKKCFHAIEKRPDLPLQTLSRPRSLSKASAL